MADAQVIVKDRAAEPLRRVLSVHERKSLQEAAAVYGYADAASESYPEGARGFGAVAAPFLRVNRPRLNEQQKRVIQVLKDGTPEPVDPKDRDALRKRAGSLREQFEPFLQTREMIHVKKRDNPVFFKALDAARDWTKPSDKLGGRSPQDVAEDYRSLMRRLEPDDEFADSLDRLRKEK